MALKIRLARGGAKKRPFYQIVIADARSPRDGRFVEKVGSYNPMLPQDNQNRVRLNLDRINYWLSVGAQPTDRVALFLGKANVIEMPIVHPTPQKSTPKTKAQERLKAEEEKLKSKAEAAEKPSEPKAVEEKVVAPPPEEEEEAAAAEVTVEPSAEAETEDTSGEDASAPTEEASDNPTEEVTA